MIKGIPIVSVWVLDQEAAKQFYVEKLGCPVNNGVALENGRRWLTVRPAGSSRQELLLMDPAHSMLMRKRRSRSASWLPRAPSAPG